MGNVSIHKAGELQADVKSAVEQLLGRPIQADEEVSVVAIPPRYAAPSRDRAAAARELDNFLNRREQKVRDIPDEEIDSAIDDAADHVRHDRG